MGKVIKTGDEANQGLKSGIDLVANIVKTTLGPYGHNAIIEDAFGNPIATNDGLNIAKQIEGENEIQEQGVKIIRQVADKTNRVVGDGTSTSILLTQKIIEAGLKAKGRLLDIRKQINDAKGDIIRELKEISTTVEEKDIEKVAFVSVEDNHIAKIVSDVVKKVGKDGVITVEDSNTLDIEWEIMEGLKFNTGFTAPHFITDINKQEAVYKDIKVLVTNENINHIDKIVPFIQECVKAGVKEFVIIAKDWSNEMVGMLVVNKLKGMFTGIAIKMPAFEQEAYIEDIIAVTGAKLVDIDLGDKPTIEHLGGIKKIVSTATDTIIVGGKKNRIAEKIKELEARNPKDDFEENNIKDRIARLKNGIGIIKVGANTDTERNYLKDKIEDAKNATQAALDEGIVQGGGVTLMKISKKLPKNILTKAIQSSYEQIQDNAGGNLDIGEDIIDPTKVVRVSLENACSAAGIFLTTSTAIAKEKEDNKPQLLG